MHKSPEAFVTIHQRDQAPLREEIPHFLFTVTIAYTSNENPARLILPKQVLFTLQILCVFAPWRCEAHRQRPRHT